MRRKTHALWYALAFLVLAEWALRSNDRRTPPELPTAAIVECPVVLLLGSSQTAMALAPRHIEDELAAAGVADSWVADVANLGLTNLGMLIVYRNTIRPHIGSDTIPNGLVGIEVRGAAMNDNFVADIERGFIAKYGFPRLDESLEDSAAAQPEPYGMPRGPWSALVEGDVHEAAAAAFAHLRIVQARDDLQRPLVAGLQSLIAPRVEHQDDAASRDNCSDAARRFQAAGFRWARDDKGWLRGRSSARMPNLDQERMRRHFQNTYLKNYHRGGVQTAALRQLIRDVRADGMTPFLYTLPVALVHRDFYPAGEYQAFLDDARALAESEHVSYFDLDTEHGLDDDRFHDTHHLRNEAAEEFSRSFTRRVLVPLLDD